MRLKVLLVGGTFSEGGGHPSDYVSQLYGALGGLDVFEVDYLNGGTVQQLDDVLRGVQFYSAVLWLASTHGSAERDIKLGSACTLLVTSRNNLRGIYGYPEIISRMLSIRANLCLVFTMGADGTSACTLLDPLGNVFVKEEVVVQEVARALAARLVELGGFTRVGSHRIGDSREIPGNERFFNIARSFAGVFHSMVHAHDTTRFLGNLSFRCTRGFPSFRNEDLIYVSKRNLGTGDLGRDGFIAVMPEYVDGSVGYFGDMKPSIVAPVQVTLYSMYPSIKYMLHSPGYVRGAPFIEGKLPCGAIEEVAAIEALVPPSADVLFASVNLRGQGSIVMTNDLACFDHVEYYGRDLPEA